jgi:hypothetical protein
MGLRRHLPFEPAPEVLALAAKDLLRTARFGLRRAEEMLPEPPIPGADLARRVAAEAAGFAAGVASRVLTPGPPGVLPRPAAALRSEAQHAGAGAAFAGAGYRALRLILGRLGATDALVSETQLRLALADAAASPEGDAARFAADLAVAILDRHAIADVAQAGGSEAPAALARLAAVALGLAIAGSTRPETDEAEAARLLTAAADLARSLEREIAAAGSDPAALAAFLARYAPHV